MVRSMAKKSKGDVCWWSRKYKNPIAWSTVADSDAISLINEPNQTANDLMEILKSGKFLVNDDIIRIVQTYIDKGLGNEILITKII